MAETLQNGNEMLGDLQARLTELATCSEGEFNADHAMNAIEEAVGGSLASATHRAAIVDFSSHDVDHLERVVNRFDQNPPVVTGNADLDLYANLVEEAQMLIPIRREQIEREMRFGGRNARIDAEMAEQLGKQRQLFLDSSHNTLNAAGDLSRIRARRQRSDA